MTSILQFLILTTSICFKLDDPITKGYLLFNNATDVDSGKEMKEWIQEDFLNIIRSIYLNELTIKQILLTEERYQKTLLKEIFDYQPLYDTYFALRNKYKNETNQEKTNLVPLDEEKKFVDLIMVTCAMSRVIKYLSNYGYVDDDKNAIREMLLKLWFTKVNDGNSLVKANAFERIFITKPAVLDNKNQETPEYLHHDFDSLLAVLKKLDPLNFKQILAEDVAIIGMNNSSNAADLIKNPMLLGVSIPLEMAIYTSCYFLYANEPCKISIDLYSEFNVMVKTAIVNGEICIMNGYPII